MTDTLKKVSTFLWGVMSNILGIFGLIMAGLFLLWFGYMLFFGRLSPWYPGWWPWKGKGDYMGKAGDPQVCPMCSVKLRNGEQVKTIAFPVSTSLDRLMYIRGCSCCLNSDLPRRCPVCKDSLSEKDYLIARLFERYGRKNHVHILGCNHCRRGGKLPPIDQVSPSSNEQVTELESV